MNSLVIGATGKIGSYIVSHLAGAGERPWALSRDQHSSDGVRWLRGDLTSAGSIQVPPVEVVFCTANPSLFAASLPRLYRQGMKRVIMLTSSSILTKLESEVDDERETLNEYIQAERDVSAFCDRNGMKWTILRPTLVYCEGRDGNITRIYQTIRRFGFMPLSGKADGLRQPVHAEDIATGAIAAAGSGDAENKTYVLPGGETITYREMIGRVFDGMGRRRMMISLPPSIWRVAFASVKVLYPDFNGAMGDRMSKSMTFDASAAANDFAWSPRAFHPDFRITAEFPAP